MSDMTPEATVVVLLDWQGKVVWYSSENPQRALGYAAEEYVRVDQQAMVKEAVHQVVVHRKSQQYQVVAESGESYRVWLWPLDSPEVAVCALAIHVPRELALLTNREQDCLMLLAQGWPVGRIADRLGIAVSTVHTHFRRAREKLNLPSLEALISFAARHCDTFPSSLNDQGNHQRV
jgi:DNA-binding CsgD family transcriptional regulator